MDLIENRQWNGLIGKRIPTGMLDPSIDGSDVEHVMIVSGFGVGEAVGWGDGLDRVKCVEVGIIVIDDMATSPELLNLFSGMVLV